MVRLYSNILRATIIGYYTLFDLVVLYKMIGTQKPEPTSKSAFLQPQTLTYSLAFMFSQGS